MSFEMMQLLVYLVAGIAVVFYVVLDGFDLGVGALHLFAGSDRDKRIFLNSIGPFWDGNEVWLIAIVGVLFVGFPDVYAAVLSGMYLLVMLMLLGIIARAVAIEFRSKLPEKAWRMFWDFIFWLGSVIISFSAGVTLGNFVKGFHLDIHRELHASFAGLFTAYPVFVGILSIFLFAMHGNLFLLLKTEGELQERLHRMTSGTILLFYIFFALTTYWTWKEFPYMGQRYLQYPLFWLLPIIMSLFMIAIPLCVRALKYGWAFLSSILSMAFLFLLYGVGTFPNMVISTINPAFNLTLFNASSSKTTLTVTLIIVVIGVPMVIAYGWFLYYIFRGKTKLHDHSY